MSLHRLPPPPPFLPIEDDWLNLSAFCRALKLVLTRESTDLPPNIDLQALFLVCLTPDDGALVRLRGDETLVHLLVMFIHYADWAASVGVALGFKSGEALIADHWAVNLPRTYHYLKHLSKEVTRCIAGLSRQLQKDQGYNLGAVYVDAIQRNESPEQTRLRHRHASRGLKQIKGNNDDNG